MYTNQITAGVPPVLRRAALACTAAAVLAASLAADAAARTRPEAPPIETVTIAKQAANAAAAQAPRRHISAASLQLSGTSGGPQSPQVSAGVSKEGQVPTNLRQPDTAAAIGPKRFIQLVNSRYGIYKRNGKVISEGSLTELLSSEPDWVLYQPQVIWDANSRKFFVAAVIEASPEFIGLRLAFSKTAAPAGPGDWCFSGAFFNTEYPDSPKLGDSRTFVHVGMNMLSYYDDSFVRADIASFDKPTKGNIAACPDPASILEPVIKDLRDSDGNQIFAPAPANMIDRAGRGVVVARNMSLPSDELWLYEIRKNAAGKPKAGAAKPLSLPFDYDMPPDADQPGFPQLIDTGDARVTQAVLARNPGHGGDWSLWMQHTIADDSSAAVQWYDVQPFGEEPELWAQGRLSGGAGAHFYNAAISPDRQVGKATSRFGENFAIVYNVSSAQADISPRIVVGSSQNGGPVSTLLVKDAAGPYRDGSCPEPGDTCRWGAYAAASPDPVGANSDPVGRVWIANEFSGLPNPSPTGVNGRTWFAAITP